MHEVSGSDYWAQRWERGESGWDLGGPCPVFVALLHSPLAPPRGRVALPGCGAGHDVLLFRERGYDATGYDFAVDADHVEHIDVFELGSRFPETFDVIVEYTCYCAIDPARRAEYAAALHAALKPGGQLIGLMYPIRPPDDDGPPFAVQEEEIHDVFGAGLELLHFETPDNSVERRLGKERLAIFRR